MWRSAAPPPAHLLRRICETCDDYKEAKDRLTASPLCIAALFVLAGTGPGEGCVIERTPDAVAIREMPAAAANHWVALNERGRPRACLSAERQCQMEESLNGLADWRAEPILNPYTRVAAVMNAALGRMQVEGWEQGMPATATRELHLNL